MKKSIVASKDLVKKLESMNSSEISALRDYCILLKDNETDNLEKEKYIECIVSMSEVLKKRIHELMSEENTYFITEFKSRLERAGVTNKFEEQINLKKFPQHINLKNVGSYENKDNWNEFLNIVDFYYPGILLEYYPDIPFKNYVTNISN